MSAAALAARAQSQVPDDSGAPRAAAPPGGSPAPTPERGITVRAQPPGERLRRSSAAVTVVDTREARRESADLGEVLARTQGVAVRRAGGLGSPARFSLNGLYDDQIRFFLDGVPLEFTGFGLGIANIPVNLVERLEVYRGVVPVRFGADALGGAVNVVSGEQYRGTHASGSYEAGMFGTYRVTASARHGDARTGLFASAYGFADHARNDYPVQVEVPDARGRLAPATVRRFHDGYVAYGGGAEVGVVGRAWARRLLLRVYGTRYDRELQHNVVMTVPYGEVTYGETVLGATLRYEQPLLRTLELAAVGGYAFRATDFRDVGTGVYDWFGRVVRARRTPGELSPEATDQTLWQHSAFARATLAWTPLRDHVVRLALAPTIATRTGENRYRPVPNGRDPLTAQRDLFTLVSGLEYQLTLFGGRLENVAFAKDYVYVAASEEPLPGGVFARRDRATHDVGAGDALRFRFTEWLWAKASYEYATRLPRPDEVFGNGVLVVPNLALEPERSHNANLSLTLDARRTPAGAFRAEVNGFARLSDRLIVLLGNDRVFSYQNVYSARAVGVEANAGWTSPGEYVALDANVTFQDVRNASAQGTFADFAGDRIPNRPWLFANAAARVQLRGLATRRDELALTWRTRYVHEFYRGWESQGLREFKQTVDSQLLHAVALTYSVRGPATVTGTFEVQNLTDAPAFDFFGVQRPGRAAYFKLTIEF